MALGLFWPLADIGWGMLCSDLFKKTKKATQKELLFWVKPFRRRKKFTFLLLVNLQLNQYPYIQVLLNHFLYLEDLVLNE